MKQTDTAQTEYQYLDALSRNFPGGFLFRFQIEAGKLEKPDAGGHYPPMDCVYLSPSWEQLSHHRREDGMANFTSFFLRAHCGDNPDEFIRSFYRCLISEELFNVETRCRNGAGEYCWMQFSTQPRREGNMMVCDGFALNITARKQVEHELIAEKLRMQVLDENLPNGALYQLTSNLATGERRMTYLSPRWECLTGIKSEDAMQNMKLLDEPIHPDDLAHMHELERKSIETMSNFSCEVRITADRPRWALLTSSPHREGNSVVWDGAMFDITDLKTAEQHLREEHNRLESISNNLPSCTLYSIVSDRQTGQYRATYLGASWERITGIPKADAMADFSTIYSAIHPDDLTRFISYERECFQQMRNFSTEVRIAAAGGWRWVLVSAHPHADSGTTAWDGIVLDISERRQTQQHLTEANSKLEALSNNIHSGSLFRCEIDAGKLDSLASPVGLLEIIAITYTSASWESITGITATDSMNSFVAVMKNIYHDDRQTLLNAMHSAIVSRQALDAEVRYTHSSTGTRWIRISVSIRNESNTVVCDGIVLDVTERKQNEIELSTYRDKLEHLVKRRTEELQNKNTQLEASEEKLRNFIEQSFEGIIMFDHEGRITEWNRAMERITGMEAEKVLGRLEWDVRWMFYPIEERTPWALDSLHRRRLEFMLSDSPPVTSELTLQALDGTIRHTRASTFSIVTGDRKYFGRIVRDNTRQRYAELELTRYRMNLEQMVAIKTRELKEGSERLTTLSDNLPGGVIYQMKDHAGRSDAQFTYVSAQFAAMFGISGTELLADASLFFLTLHPDDIARLIAFLNDAGNAGMLDTECRVIIGNATRWIHMRAAYHTDEADTRIWDGFMLDITESKHASIELEKTNRRIELSQRAMRTVLDNVSANIYVADLATNEVLFANKTLKDELGHITAGKKCWELIRGKTGGICDFCPSPILQQNAQQRNSVHRWEYLNEKNGRWYDSADSIIEWIDGRNVHLQCATDITQRKKASEAQRRSEEMYRSLSEASPDAVVLFDTEGKIIFLSPKARELYHIGSSEHLTGKTLADYTHPNNMAETVEIFNNFIAGNLDDVSFMPLVTSLRSDGTAFPAEVSAAAIKDAGGQTSAVIAVIRDITDRLNAETELLHAKNRAEESDRLKSSFLANLSHEIRTPLNGIAGLLSVLAHDPDITDDIRENIDDINRNSDRLLSIVNDVLDAARIETGQMTLRPEPVCIGSMMNELHSEYTQRLIDEGKKRIALNLILPDAPFRAPGFSIHADPVRLRQILRRLLNNSVKFTDRGHISFGCSLQGNGMLEFFVEDTGIGIPQSHLEVIFNSFRQVDQSNIRRYEGLGLGLSIARGLARLMCGDMHGHSTEGEGTRFVAVIKCIPCEGSTD
ncbi:MAG: PAS domain S-box protein [Bacteroidales bacterium]|jgi:PAS domain S-box-containing protein|nr:PAS domain S-box protein [Bacteroidales bacterium]